MCVNASTCTVHGIIALLYMSSINELYIPIHQSRDILRKIERRELYKCVGQTAPRPGLTLHRVSDCV